MIGMVMAVDHRHHRLLRPMGVIEIERDPGRARRSERVDQNDAGPGFDNRHLRCRIIAHLIDAIRHLEEAIGGIELRLTPKAGVDGRRRRAVIHEGIGLVLWVRNGGDEAPGRVVEILAVGERQFSQHRLVGGGDVRLCGLGFLGLGRRREETGNDNESAPKGHRGLQMGSESLHEAPLNSSQNCI